MRTQFFYTFASTYISCTNERTADALYPADEGGWEKYKVRGTYKLVYCTRTYTAYVHKNHRNIFKCKRSRMCDEKDMYVYVLRWQSKTRVKKSEMKESSNIYTMYIAVSLGHRYTYTQGTWLLTLGCSPPILLHCGFVYPAWRNISFQVSLCILHYISVLHPKKEWKKKQKFLACFVVLAFLT